MTVTRTETSVAASPARTAEVNQRLAGHLISLGVTTREQEFALLARILHRERYDDHNAGHITMRLPDGNYLVNPQGYPWNDRRASDVLVMDSEANLVRGDGFVPPAVVLHVELHKVRPDADIVIHHHPHFATTYAAAHRVPPVYDQMAAMVDDDEVLVYRDHDGPVSNRDASRAAAAQVGPRANYVLLVNHGVLILGQNVRQALARGTWFEWRCKRAWYVEAIGGGTPMAEPAARAFVEMVHRRGDTTVGLFETGARREIREDPAVLT